MKKIISLLLCAIILVNTFGVCSLAANETDSTLIPTPYFNNTSSIEVTFLINSSGLGTVATSYVGTSGITTHADISIKLEKKFLFFWTDVDIGYPDDCASLLMAPFNTKYSGAAIGKVVAGKLNPSGKLSSSVYHYTEDQYISYKTRRVRDKVKSGPFIGYRYYDTSAEAPGFPFGHGLSFTRFDYLGMTVSSDKVNVTVKNGSKLAGEEIIQI